MREPVRNTITIYWDRAGMGHHVLLCDVFENGEHEVRLSQINPNAGTTLEKVIKYWDSVVGTANIRAYNIVEHIQDAGKYGFVSER